MIDKEKVRLANIILQDSGADAYMLLVFDPKENGLFLEGTRKELVLMLANAMCDDNHIATIVYDAVKVYLEYKKREGGENAEQE